MRTSALLAILLPLFTACGTPCEPSVTADTLIFAADQCLPGDGTSNTRGGSTTGMDATSEGSTDGHATGVQTQTSAPDPTTSGGTDATASGTDGSTGPTGTSSESSSGGTTAEQAATGEPEPDACFGDQCDTGCAPGLICTAHPDNASLAVCASPCTLEGPPCALSPNGCSEDAPLGECRVDFMGSILCFPILCPAFDCPDGSECVDGRCT
jgi:hypothetical protein